MPKRRSSPQSIPSIDDLSDWTTLAEAQTVLKIGRVALTNLLKRGEIKARKFGRRLRISRESLRP